MQQLEEDNKGTRNDGKEKMALAQVLEQKVSALEKVYGHRLGPLVACVNVVQHLWLNPKMLPGTPLCATHG